MGCLLSPKHYTLSREDRHGGHPFFTALAGMSEGRVVPVPGGGVLIRDAAGAVIGGVGISGDVSDKDEACALAGIQAAGLTGDTGG